LPHPFFLGWHHLEVFRHLLSNTKVSHFLYMEDDLLISEKNIRYWLIGRKKLRHRGLYPSFVRVEKRKNSDVWYSTDCTEHVDLSKLPSVRINDRYRFFGLPNPYQGMYLMDRELMSEHLSGPSSHPDFGPWGIREKAAQGLTFLNVPQGFGSRNVVGYNCETNQIDSHSWIHHMTNNYANDPSQPFGKIPILELSDRQQAFNR
jgi:hypothetical protein